MMSEFLYKDLTYQIIGAADEVQKTLGYGFLEKVYENALTVELQRRGRKVDQQAKINVYYKGALVGYYEPDLIVDDVVIVEIKVETFYKKRHEAQLLNYLKATGIKVGLLIDFGEDRCHVERFVM
jgi:GxxExxY protein